MVEILTNIVLIVLMIVTICAGLLIVYMMYCLYTLLNEMFNHTRNDNGKLQNKNIGNKN